MNKRLIIRQLKLLLTLPLLLLGGFTVEVQAQSSPFLANYIGWNDTISYDFFNLNYLIITADSLRPAFRDFAMSKALKGYNVTIAAVEDIYQTYASVADSAERIKWYIAEKYMQTGRNLQYVLLGGDATIVPTRFAAPRYIQYSNYTPTAEGLNYVHYYDSLKLIASDVYYVSFNGSFDWDDGNNGKYAETGEMIQTYSYGNVVIIDDHAIPRQYANISRIPVRNSTDIMNYTSKLFRYERDELKSHSAYSRALFAGCKAFSEINGASDSKYWGDSIINNFVSDLTVYRLYDTNFTKAKLKSRLAYALGSNLVNIDTHGIETGWRMNDTTTYYDVSMAESQTGVAASIITTPACDVGDFSANQSLGKSIILNASNNTIAFWAATNKGFGPTDSELLSAPGLSRELIGNFYRHLMNEPNKQLGNIIDKAKRDIEFFVDRYSPERYLMLTQTLLGDAEVEIMKTRPNHIDPFDIFINGGYALMDDFDEFAHYNIMMDSEDETLCTHNSDYTEFYPMAEWVDEDFLYEGPFQIGIKKSGYAPWRSDKDGYKTVYIQGTELNGENIKAQKVIIGSALDTDFQIGSNSIAVDGSAAFIISDELEITDNFTCPVGATLNVYPINQ